MFLRIKKIPKTSWSSDNPLNLKPKLKTFVILCLGLVVFGFGSSLLIHSNIGNAPWVVLAEGLSKQLNWSIGFSTFMISLIVLSLWIPLAQKPGIGTIMNILIIAIVLDLSQNTINLSSNLFFINFLTALLGIVIAGLGSGIYLIANLGPGPRDGLTTGLQRTSGYPIAWIRTFIEISVVLIGWALGGTVGIGTILFTMGVGPSIAFSLNLIGKN